jgi:type VI secretion system secreted protein VgrG
MADDLMTLTVPEDVKGLVLTRLSGTEYLSRLFRFRLDLLGPASDPITFDKMLGKSVTVGIPILGGGTRYLNGIISRFVQVAPVANDKYIPYRAIMVPQFWQLTKIKQCWAYQNVTVPQIINQLLPNPPYKFTTAIQGTENFPTLQCCVQYRESSFHFLSRLLEQEGLFYYFQHETGKHTAMIGNASWANMPVAAPNTVGFAPGQGAGPTTVGQITRWRFGQRVASGSYTLWDYSFELSQTNLSSQAQSLKPEVSVGKKKVKLNLPISEKLTKYDYPGYYAWQYDNVDAQGNQGKNDISPTVKDAAQRYGQLWMQRSAVESLRIRGSSDCAQFQAGCKFNVDGTGKNWEGTYLLTAVRHQADQTAAVQGEKGAALRYSNRFTALPWDTTNLPYVPPKRHRKPTVKGIQTGVVVGVSGQDISTDPNARVKVQFFWNTQGSADMKGTDGTSPPNFQYWKKGEVSTQPESSPPTPTNSAWVRVAQGWAGRGWGHITIPRLGQEVVVDFLEGDPDQPLVVGSVYNSTNGVPFAPLPTMANASGMKTFTPGGDLSKDYSGLAFNDTKGNELVQLLSNLDLILNTKRHMVQNVPGNLYQNIGGKTVKLAGGLPDLGGETQTYQSKADPATPPFGYPPNYTGTGVVSKFFPDYTINFGETASSTLGISLSHVVGSSTSVVVNPLYLWPANPATMFNKILAAGLLLGRNNLIFAQQLEFFLGVKTLVITGGKIETMLGETTTGDRGPVGNYFFTALKTWSKIFTLASIVILLGIGGFSGMVQDAWGKTDPWKGQLLWGSLLGLMYIPMMIAYYYMYFALMCKKGVAWARTSIDKIAETKNLLVSVQNINDYANFMDGVANAFM